jgi:hypothetical protein
MGLKFDIEVKMDTGAIFCVIVGRSAREASIRYRTEENRAWSQDLSTSQLYGLDLSDHNGYYMYHQL